jgi:DNA topoisomerase IB
VRRAVDAALGEVAERLGNPAAVTRASYVDPAVIEAWHDGAVARVRVGNGERSDRDGPPTPDEEAAVLRLLERQAREASAKGRRVPGSRARS